MSSDNPFWFANEELLTDLLRNEIHHVTELFAKYPDLRKFFDLPVASVEQRAACFALLAHRNLMGEIYETFAGRYEESPSLGDEEKEVLRRTQNLVAADAPAWVLEIDQVAELLPSRVYDALPEPLHSGGFGFDPDNAEQMQAIQSAKETLSNVEQIQAWTGKVVGEQLLRLEGRWSASIPTFQTQQPPLTKQIKRKGWEQRLKLYAVIQKVLSDNPSLQGMDFCATLDKRHAKPLFDWVKRGQWREGLTWKEAWRDPSLRRKIRRVRQEALNAR